MSASRRCTSSWPRKPQWPPRRTDSLLLLYIMFFLGAWGLPEGHQASLCWDKDHIIPCSSSSSLVAAGGSRTALALLLASQQQAALRNLAVGQLGVPNIRPEHSRQPTLSKAPGLVPLGVQPLKSPPAPLHTTQLLKRKERKKV